jgi:hypothetical protein
MPPWQGHHAARKAAEQDRKTILDSLLYAICGSLLAQCLKHVPQPRSQTKDEQQEFPSKRIFHLVFQQPAPDVGGPKCAKLLPAEEAGFILQVIALGAPVAALRSSDD